MSQATEENQQSQTSQNTRENHDAGTSHYWLENQ